MFSPPWSTDIVITVSNIHHLANITARLGHATTKELLEILEDCITKENLEDYVALALRLKGTEVRDIPIKGYVCNNCGEVHQKQSNFCSNCGCKIVGAIGGYYE